ncbi:MAG TPA: hypothetical protein VEX62_13695 [Candidatus Limnocylindrales bacterium]|nr:hypothetical protein [Candidatus Limnocylindrales bacterium]
MSIGPLASGSVPLPSGATLPPTGIPTALSGATVEPTRKPRPSRNPTQAPTDQATATATSAPTATASTEPTATASTAATPAPTLNFSLPGVYGSTALTSGFVPDPFTVGVTSGGEASASYLGGGCYGYTTAAPTFSVNFTSGDFTLLRFYFIGAGDTTMIVNSPAGTYSCVDDSFGTTNPTVDFNVPSSGRYDIWVASYNPADAISGTLYVTENSGNHP